MMSRRIYFTGFVLAAAIVLTGCENIYYLLQKEGAQEKKILGEALPLEANPTVEEVQKLLKLYGYPIGNVDGKIGPATRNAILKFQRDNALEETRFVDDATWARLNVFGQYDLIVQGEINNKAVQQALLNAGYGVGKIDGVLGPQSKRILMQFQKAQGLRPDGIIGLKTLKLLAAQLPVVSSVIVENKK